MEGDIVKIIGLIVTACGGFFALMRYMMSKQSAIVKEHADRQREIAAAHDERQKELTETFLSYIEKKNGNLERVAGNFADHVEKTNNTMTQVAVRLKENSDAVKEALKEHRRK